MLLPYAEIFSEDELTSLTGWTEYDGAIHETAEDAEKFVYYVKVTDNAGNITCFASNGATFDLTNPVIDGIVDGSTYYTTQKVTVTDTNLDSVTLNSEQANLENGSLTLSGNTEATYTITAAGNVNTENATEEEKTALQDILDNCDILLGKIGEVKQEISDVTSGADGYDADSVKSSDKDDMEALVECIDTLLDGENMTDDEKAQLNETLQQIEDALDVIQRVEDVEEAIGGLPESVSTTGTFAITEKPIEPTDEDSASPKTGDDLHMTPWIILMLISGGAVLTLSVRHRSKKGMSK